MDRLRCPLHRWTASRPLYQSVASSQSRSSFLCGNIWRLPSDTLDLFTSTNSRSPVHFVILSELIDQFSKSDAYGEKQTGNLEENGLSEINIEGVRVALMFRDEFPVHIRLKLEFFVLFREEWQLVFSVTCLLPTRCTCETASDYLMEAIPE